MTKPPEGRIVVENSADDAAAFGMTELEETLRGANGAQIANELLVRFEKIDATLRAGIAAGLTPESFASATVIRNSLAAASNILVLIPKGNS
jgi:hypothetical protein